MFSFKKNKEQTIISEIEGLIVDFEPLEGDNFERRRPFLSCVIEYLNKCIVEYKIDLIEGNEPRIFEYKRTLLDCFILIKYYSKKNTYLESQIPKEFTSDPILARMFLLEDTELSGVLRRSRWMTLHTQNSIRENLAILEVHKNSKDMTKEKYDLLFNKGIPVGMRVNPYMNYTDNQPLTAMQLMAYSNIGSVGDESSTHSTKEESSSSNVSETSNQSSYQSPTKSDDVGHTTTTSNDSNSGSSYGSNDTGSSYTSMD